MPTVGGGDKMRRVLKEIFGKDIPKNRPLTDKEKKLYLRYYMTRGQCCSRCGKYHTAHKKFCSDCGTQLPNHVYAQSELKRFEKQMRVPKSVGVV